MSDAFCLGQTEKMFPEGKGRTSTESLEKKVAAKVCNSGSGCPVREECLEQALARHEPWGVWGGKTSKERFAILASRRRRQVRSGA